LSSRCVPVSVPDPWMRAMHRTEEVGREKLP
jgi:hypothetical protein